MQNRYLTPLTSVIAATAALTACGGSSSSSSSADAPATVLDFDYSVAEISDSAVALA